MRRKPANQSKQIHKNWVIASITGLILFGAFIFSRSTNRANINFVGNVPTPTYTPYPSAKCYPNIASLNAQNACSTDLVSYRQIEYKCSNGKGGGYGAPNGNCMRIADILRDADKVCGNICEVIIPSPSPVPSPSQPPSPPPTADPSTSISCTPALYRIPGGSPIAPHNLTSFMSPEYEVDPKDTTVKPGEFYLHGMKIANISRQQISTAWSYFQMRATPIITDRTQEIQTQYSWSEGCTIDSMDTIYCPAEHFSIPAGQSVVLKQPLFVTVISKTPYERPTTSGYHIYLQSPSGNIIKDCGTEMMTNFNIAPSPTPTQIPYWSCIYQCVVKSRQSIAACREICKK